MDKMNFNIFIRLYWKIKYIYIYISVCVCVCVCVYFLGGFPVVGMKKKYVEKNNKKNKKKSNEIKSFKNENF